jgi:hypothetical protein
MKKNCINPECKKEFEPKSSKGTYCSPACKSRHQYIARKAASEPAPITPPKPIKDPMRPWIEEIEQYCLSKGIFPDALIEFHQMHCNSDITRALQSIKKSFNSR